MEGLKYYERTKLLIELIEKKKTGGPGDLARNIGVSKRMVYLIIDDLRLSLGKDISYSKEVKSYIFIENSSWSERLFHRYSNKFDYQLNKCSTK
jgi:transcriptional antiterminator